VLPEESFKRSTIEGGYIQGSVDQTNESFEMKIAASSDFNKPNIEAKKLVASQFQNLKSKNSVLVGRVDISDEQMVVNLKS